MCIRDRTGLKAPTNWLCNKHSCINQSINQPISQWVLTTASHIQTSINQSTWEQHAFPYQSIRLPFLTTASIPTPNERRKESIHQSSEQHHPFLRQSVNLSINQSVLTAATNTHSHINDSINQSINPHNYNTHSQINESINQSALITTQIPISMYQWINQSTLKNNNTHSHISEWINQAINTTKIHIPTSINESTSQSSFTTVPQKKKKETCCIRKMAGNVTKCSMLFFVFVFPSHLSSS